MELYSINNPVFDGEGNIYADIIQDERNLEDEVCFKMDMRQKLSTLSENERVILKMKVSGYNDEEISQSLSLHVQTVKNAISHLSSKICGKSQPQLELSF